MAFIETIPACRADDEVKAMYLRQQGAYGYVPNYAKVFSHRPELMGLWADLQRGIKKSMCRKYYELATVAAALELKSTYCSLAHASVLREFYSEVEIKSIVTGRGVSDGVISEAVQALMDFSRKIARDAASVTQADINEMRRHGFSEGQIFDIVATAAARSFFTKIVDGLGSMGDHDYPDVLPDLKQSLVTGRAIEVSRQETV